MINLSFLNLCATIRPCYEDFIIIVILFIPTFFSIFVIIIIIIIMVQVFNYKSYAGTSTVKYFTSGDFLKFPVRAEPPSPLPSQQQQQQQQQQQ